MYEKLIEQALDLIDQIRFDRQRPVEYAIEQLLYRDRDEKDQALMASVIQREVDSVTRKWSIV